MITADTLYEQAAGELGLYGVAFYGHRGTVAERAALRRAWRKAQGEARRQRQARRMAKVSFTALGQAS